ncbi:MAG TPA: copper resistance protein CopC [Acidimicrobiales bacterium]|nr:copper resistance protein CopC [Acidimicrobiales bacterium]
MTAGRPARLLCGLGLGLAALTAAAPAGGHAAVVSASPPAGASLRTAPGRVVLVFEERPDPVLSAIDVLDSAGVGRAVGALTSAPGRPDALARPVPALPDGVYTVAWRAVAAADGHLETGSYRFGVRVPVTGTHGVAEKAAGPSWAGAGARWAYEVGVIGLVGLAFVALSVFEAPPERVIRWGLWLSWGAAVVGALGIAAAQASVDGVGPGRLLSSSAGVAAVARAAPLLEAALAVGAVLVWRGRWRRAALAGVGVYAALSMFADVHVGHAAAASSWAWLHEAVLGTHFLAVGVWIGGLVAVLACLPGTDPAQRAAGLLRYSGAAVVAVFAVAFTGTVEAVAEVPSGHALLSTGFGRVVLAKVAFIVVLGGLGAVNRYRNVPLVLRSVAPLRRVAVAEVGIAACALVAAAVLPGFDPGGRAPAATPAPTAPVASAAGE